MSAATGEERTPWSPIVIGDPIFGFEPKPPARGPYRADTVFDGWSAGDFTVRLASVRGYSHRYHGSPRQDDAQAAFFKRAGAVVFAVADGVSGASLSHMGASAVCESAIDNIMWQLSADPREIDWFSVLEDTVRSLNAWAAYALGREQVTAAEVESRFATTLVAGYVRPAPGGLAASMIGVGDSGAWLLRQGRFHPALAEKNDPQAPVISSAVSPLPRIPAVVAPVRFRLPLDAVLLVGSDGFGDPLGDGSGKVGQLFAGHLASPPPGRALAHLLDFSRETFDDDRTLIAIWPRLDGQEAK